MRTLHITFVCVAATSIAGCAPRQRRFHPPQEPTALDDTAFLHYLATVPVVTVDEGTRATLLLVGATKDFATFEARAEELQRRNAYRAEWSLPSQEILNKGTLAYILAGLCDTPQSVGTSLASRTHLGDRRAAVQVCVYEGLLAPGRSDDLVSGGELLAALDAADRYTAERGVSAP